MSAPTVAKRLTKAVAIAYSATRNVVVDDGDGVWAAAGSARALVLDGDPSPHLDSYDLAPNPGSNVDTLLESLDGAPDVQCTLPFSGHVATLDSQWAHLPRTHLVDSDRRGARRSW